jgi:hypothetical protein
VQTKINPYVFKLHFANEPALGFYSNPELIRQLLRKVAWPGISFWTHKNMKWSRMALPGQPLTEKILRKVSMKKKAKK